MTEAQSIADQKDLGVAATPPGHSAEPEPVPVSAASAASVPNAEYEVVFVPMAFERPVGRTVEEWRKNVRQTDLYRRGDTVLVWVNEADLYCDGPFVKHWRRTAQAIEARRAATPESGAVEDESAVPKGCAQNTQSGERK